VRKGLVLWLECSVHGVVNEKDEEFQGKKGAVCLSSIGTVLRGRSMGFGYNAVTTW
jgi:hypothetical protein